VYGEWVDAAGKPFLSLFPRAVLTGRSQDSVAHGGDATGGPASSARMAKVGLSQRADDDEEDDRRYEGEGVVGDDEFD
jgi:hypothetical protein